MSIPVPVLIIWWCGLALAIWWPRPSDQNSARARAYRLLARAASCHLLGFLSWSLLLWALLAYIAPGEDLLLSLVLLLAPLGALSLTAFALGMLALDLGIRWLGLAASVLAALFSTGVTCFGLLMILNVYTGGIPWWMVCPALAETLLCGCASWLLLETYTVMRAPRTGSGEGAE